MVLTLQSPVEQLPRVGKTIARRLRNLGIESVAELLGYYPMRYEDLSHVDTINALAPGQRATIKVKVNLIENRRSPYRRKMLTEALVSDASGSLKIIWFNQPFLTKVLNVGDAVYLSGKVESSEYGFQMVSPTYEKERKEQIHTARIVPVYSLTEELTNKQLRYFIKLVFPLIRQIVDWLPPDIVQTHKLMELRTAVQQIHFPENPALLQKAQERLKFNELFTLLLKARISRRSLMQEQAPAIPYQQDYIRKFVGSLPFTLTQAQKKAAWEILRDMEKRTPMNRLLEGDVGSGKTVVAAMAMVSAVRAGFQSALMAPTEILAEQHSKKVRELLAPMSIEIGLLTRSSKKMREQHVTQSVILKAIASGKLSCVVGTHALIQQKVEFKRLGLVIIDEQHRFGVEQRKKLKQRSKGLLPHLLSMTATPIPRTLALTLYGDLDLSIIDEMPPGRKKIITEIVPPQDRQATYAFVREEIKKGHQAFVICPLIDPSDVLGVKAATAEFERLKKNVFPDIALGLLHGKLRIQAKEHVMRAFAEGDIKILVATPVVEVGIDVPNATAMIIESAERFGLAQLHQFRGRIGRSEHQSTCFLFTETANDLTQQRLRALVESENGFQLAEKDLEFRGPGEVYGLRQAGFPDLKMAKLTDVAIIQKAREASDWVMQRDPELTLYPLLKKKMAYFSKKIHME